MSEAEQILRSMRENPSRGWEVADVKRVCKRYGIRCDAPKVGSHYVVSHPRVQGLLTIPYERPLKPLHIMLVVQLIDGLLE